MTCPHTSSFNSTTYTLRESGNVLGEQLPNVIHMIHDTFFKVQLLFWVQVLNAWRSFTFVRFRYFDLDLDPIELGDIDLASKKCSKLCSSNHALTPCSQCVTITYQASQNMNPLGRGNRGQAKIRLPLHKAQGIHGNINKTLGAALRTNTNQTCLRKMQDFLYPLTLHQHAPVEP